MPRRLKKAECFSIVVEGFKQAGGAYYGVHKYSYNWDRSGFECDGRVLVLHDMLGVFTDFGFRSL